jgi:hypothetical protein
MADGDPRLADELRSNGVSVESLDRADDGERASLTYLTAFPGDEVNHQEMGRVCNVFIDRADDGEWDPEPVDVTVVRADDDVQGTWRIDPDWIVALLEYRLSETEFSTRVLNTLDER